MTFTRSPSVSPRRYSASDPDCESRGRCGEVRFAERSQGELVVPARCDVVIVRNLPRELPTQRVIQREQEGRFGDHVVQLRRALGDELRKEWGERGQVKNVSGGKGRGPSNEAC